MSRDCKTTVNGRHLLETDGVGVYFKSGLSCDYKDKCLYVPYSVGTSLLDASC